MSTGLDEPLGNPPIESRTLSTPFGVGTAFTSRLGIARFTTAAGDDIIVRETVPGVWAGTGAAGTVSGTSGWDVACKAAATFAQARLPKEPPGRANSRFGKVREAVSLDDLEIEI